ncbi:hypothetical protein QE370_002903 [Aeromicrobium sp. SORGH_AS981]|uniref:hypothetical protein n=1 Tax=Aeromicrobium sp. SORGH_AS_0981 TaxID=3041802 RepID=UPI00285ECA2E|nr:hypothetical protein [Aeromicrobium sp. SORGH_AS_0981]MDR6119719.1 hypothetical protein [Aeromicrobium sp. SORGH_AS_0981]
MTDTVTDSASDTWSSEVLEAWARLGHEAKYGTGAEAGVYGLSRVFDPLSEDQLLGLTNSVKGTAMEIRVRERAQSGEFPGLEGLPSDAHLSTSLTQSGHDVEIVNSAGEVIERIQVKAGSWESIAPRLSEYTDQGIAVAVTSETAARAREAGFGASVIDTGISGTELTERVASSVDNLGLGHSVDEFLPELAFASVALSAVMRIRTGQDPADVAVWVKSEIASTGAANAAGLAAELMTAPDGCPRGRRPRNSLDHRAPPVRSSSGSRSQGVAAAAA